MRFGNVVGGGHHVMVKRVTSAGYEVVGRALTYGYLRNLHAAREMRGSASPYSAPDSGRRVNALFSAFITAP